MTPVGGIRSGAFTAIGTDRSSRARSAGASTTPKTVQVFEPVRPTEAMPSEERYVPRHQRPDAAFLAHLIATKEHAPQTRERRRAEPQTAVAMYGAAMSVRNAYAAPLPGSELKISA